VQVVEDTFRRARNAEYKRHQAPPTIKITKKAFGLGWKILSSTSLQVEAREPLPGKATKPSGELFFFSSFPFWL
jgi:hypothetical protein